MRRLFAPAWASLSHDADSTISGRVCSTAAAMPVSQACPDLVCPGLRAARQRLVSGFHFIPTSHHAGKVIRE